VRDRYVTQVLLATFGFGLLLAVVAVLQTPGESSLRDAQGVRGRSELRQGLAVDAAPPQTTKPTHRADTSSAECELGSKVIDDCTPPEPQKICQRTRSSHEKTTTMAN
jgi:hypothetical protein